ncbi:hypothetical protein [Streptomyces sp. NPDC088762]|uniref:hypothetical protein n=1 Tax=Streptomyces sp. NPDC088762 TaxID=3365891 RepID=UPI00380D10F1
MANQNPQAFTEAAQKFESELADLSSYIQDAPMSVDGWDKEKVQADMKALGAQLAKIKRRTSADPMVHLTFPQSLDAVEEEWFAPKHGGGPNWDKDRIQEKVKKLKEFMNELEIMRD